MRKCLTAMKQRSSEDGLSLVEVLVAMMIFSMLVVGIGYSLVNILLMTKDNQARETAISLASKELDAVRAEAESKRLSNPNGGPLQVYDMTHLPVAVGNNTYTVTRTANWVNADGAIDTCGSGTSPLRYKTISVEVTWKGSGQGAKSVKTDTALVPRERVSQPDLGTLSVSVQNEAGRGVQGVTFSAVGSTTLVTQPTGADGCSFIFGVEPGSYKVKLTNTGYLEYGTQLSNPDDTRAVAAGSSAQFTFQYDKRAKYKFDYASNNLDGEAPLLPSPMVTTIFNSNKYLVVAPSSSAASVQYFYPSQIGYNVVAGSYEPTAPNGKSCMSVDPAEWLPDTTKVPTAEGKRGPTAFATPGGESALTQIPMGMVNVTGNSSYGGYLYAVSQSAAPLPGQPPCDVDTPMRLQFGKVFTTSSDSTAKIALPFGTWKLYVKTTTSQPDKPVVTPKIQILTPIPLAVAEQVDSNGMFVLDPRGVTP